MFIYEILINPSKRRNICLSASIREAASTCRLKSAGSLGLAAAHILICQLKAGGVFHPVSICRNIKVSEAGSAKLREGRKSGTGKLPAWLVKDMKNAEPDTK
jgi:hypothetical protein